MELVKAPKKEPSQAVFACICIVIRHTRPHHHFMGRGLSTFIKDMLFGDAQGLHQRMVRDFAESKARLFNTLVSSLVCSLVHSFIHPSMFLVPGLFLSHFYIICVFLFLFLLFLFLLFRFVFLYVCLVLFESIYHSIYI